ncbi:GNAT family N-acetyltransferase [Carbonactinospora thermoautotrophica]|uniref:GNAT family N-acetyltransferase n=2 Tax=Carbonactinospora thermoautotrophica TaxID=1469144 RepID=UPI00099ECC4D|nr:GNAT family N-acetyltransferase [Carbonactinospora thermoautotrophica]
MSRFPETRLETDRLVLRPFRAEDVPDLVEMFADKECATWLTVPQPYTFEHGLDWATRAAHELRETGDGIHWAVAERSTGRFVGAFGLEKTDWRVRAAVVGYSVTPARRGQGYATEALRAIAEWLLREQGFARLELRAATGNVASQRVARKAGFRREGLLRGAGITSAGRADLVVYGLTPADLDQLPLPARRFPEARLETARLVLRPLEEGDAPALRETLADADSAAWLTAPQPYTLELARDWVTAAAHELRQSGDGVHWAMVDRASGAFVGTVGLRRTDWTDRRTEVSYAVHPAARGHGYAAEAVRAVGGWVLREQGFVRLELRAATGNRASQRVAEKAGFTREGVLRQAGYTHQGQQDYVIFSLIRSDLA